MFWIVGEECRENKIFIVYEYFNYNIETRLFETKRKLVQNHDEFLEFYNQNKSI